MAHHQPSDFNDPEALANAQAMWGSFIAVSKWVAIGCVVIVALLGLAFISW